MLKLIKVHLTIARERRRLPSDSAELILLFVSLTLSGGRQAIRRQVCRCGARWHLLLHGVTRAIRSAERWCNGTNSVLTLYIDAPTLSVLSAQLVRIPGLTGLSNGKYTSIPFAECPDITRKCSWRLSLMYSNATGVAVCAAVSWTVETVSSQLSDLSCDRRQLTSFGRDAPPTTALYTAMSLTEEVRAHGRSHLCDTVGVFVYRLCHSAGKRRVELTDDDVKAIQSGPLSGLPLAEWTTEVPKAGSEVSNI